MILAVDGLTFSYNSHAVLQGVKFDLPQGEAMGILGVNGAGKSTLLKCLNRVLKPQGGVVMLDRRDMARMKPNQIAQEMGYVPQRHDRDNLSVFDSVLLGRKPYITWQATENDLAVVEKVIHSMHLEQLALRTVDTLSGGEVQKVLIARALAQEPRVMLLDEPTSNLDLRNQLEVMEMINHAAHEHGIAAAVAIHDVNLAVRHLDHLLMLKEQRVFAITPAEEVSTEMIREVYGIEVHMSRVEGRPVIIPMNMA
jgi:iron complex transport system ATP-binding protein